MLERVQHFSSRKLDTTFHLGEPYPFGAEISSCNSIFCCWPLLLFFREEVVEYDLLLLKKAVVMTTSTRLVVNYDLMACDLRGLLITNQQIVHRNANLTFHFNVKN